LNVNYLRATV